MLLVLALIALPANLLGVIALIAARRSSRRDTLLVVGLLAMLGAMATTSLTVIGCIELDHLVMHDSTQGDVAARATMRARLDDEVRLLAIIGAAAALVPWLGAVASWRSVRRLET